MAITENGLEKVLDFNENGVPADSDKILVVRVNNQGVPIEALNYTIGTFKQALVDYFEPTAIAINNAANATAKNSDAAKQSEVNAKASADEALKNSNASVISAQQSKSSEAQAATSATNANQSAISAENSKMQANRYADNANASAVNAKASEINSKTFSENSALSALAAEDANRQAQLAADEARQLTAEFRYLPIIVEKKLHGIQINIDKGRPYIIARKITAQGGVQI